MGDKYLFGDSDPAVRRLELLAGVFEESTRNFLLKASGGRRWGLAVDLGCGPGFTTRLIAQTVECDRVVGYDMSQNFLELARGSGGGVSFTLHDVTGVPLPSGYADIVFCRFLLTHLQEPEKIVSRWVTQLSPGGLLMIEETQAIRTAHPVFTRYLEIVESFLASRSNQLYAGPMVGALVLPGQFRPFLNEVRTLAVRSCDAARMFLLNLSAWKDTEFTQTNYRRESIQELERDLARIAGKQSPACDILWEIRQVAFRA